MANEDLADLEYWEEPAGNIQVGDVFADVPLLALHEDPRKDDEHGVIHLPTRRKHALLFKIFDGNWWFVPILTKAFFDDRDKFAELADAAKRGQIPGLFVLPPLSNAYLHLADRSIVYTLRPTVYAERLFDDAQGMRVATLAGAAYGAICNTFIHAFGIM